MIYLSPSNPRCPRVNRAFSEVSSSATGINFPLAEPLNVAGKELERLSVMIYNEIYQRLCCLGKIIEIEKVINLLEKEAGLALLNAHVKQRIK